MSYVTINTDVDVYLDDFSDEDILQEAFERLSEFRNLKSIRAKDQAWLDKFERIFNRLPDNEYAPSSAYYIRTEEELKLWMDKQ